MMHPEAKPDRFPDVMLLAAGLGNRLRPLTERTPKPLIEIGNMALIDRVIACAREEGALRFAVNAHHLADQIVAHFAGHPDFTVFRESERLDTGGGVRNALGALTSDPIMVMNTDAFWEPASDDPLQRLIARHRSGGHEITLLCVHPGRASGFSRSHDFCLNPHGAVTMDTGVPVIYGGTALIARHLIADAPSGPFSLYGIFEAALERDGVGGVLLGAHWYRVGDAAGLEAAERAFA